MDGIWTLSHRNFFAEKLTIKAGGALKNFPRFALAHCTGWAIMYVWPDITPNNKVLSRSD